GYFSCHWCHVMQRQSYQHAATAEFLNQHYISVKVDRELDPDLDQRLIDFVEQVRGAAGWPLNVLLTPDGYPLTGFTYLPQADFLRVLQHLNGEWQQSHPALSAAARDFFDSRLRHHEGEALSAAETSATDLVDAFVSQAMQVADELQGGFGNTSKFPNVPLIDALLDSIERSESPDPDVVAFINLSLQVMATRNLLDHVNGGFFRYATDPDWQTPHFEKMLYDNALLAELYLKAHRFWPNRGYAGIALRTLDFIETSLKHEHGGYMSSLSAVDRDNREGGAYLWTNEQLSVLLEPAELEHLQQKGQLQSQPGEFLIPPLSDPGQPAKPGIEQSILRKLQSRGIDSMPVDDKRLASWNAMMLNALTAAADMDPRFTERAQRLYEHMRDIFFDDGSLIRFAGNVDIADAVLEDYAYTALAFLRYGQRFADDDALDLARLLCERAHDQFLIDGRWQAKAEPLIPIMRGKWIIEDLVFDSPMTLWLQVALTVPDLDSTAYDSARAMLQRATREMQANPYRYGSFIMLRAVGAS
ncbi:MAG: thioredoxin domain-containing protein, partial [Gammaproteobacteria bacterium]|nr:thioredoxin domain-containing protein [Gammaproteobacteria bacterium]